MGLQTSATIRGRSYSKGNTFNAACDFTGRGSSEGSGANSYVSAGSTSSFLYYNPGAAYPYAIGNGSSTTVRCWVKADVFPYATYKVYYNSNGGSGAPGSQIKTYGSNLTLTTVKPSRSGHTFSRWNTKSDGSGTSYYPGGSYTSNADVTLYAIWTPNTYTVSYNANGGSGAPDSQTKTHGVNLTLSSTKPTRTGYTFNKWNTRSDGNGTSYKAGELYTVNSGATLYAIWASTRYVVRFHVNGGSGSIEDQIFYYGRAEALKRNAFSRIGYTFGKWNTKEDGSGTAYADGQVVSNLDANGGTVDLYAIWTRNSYTVKFDANGGSGMIASRTCYYDQAFILPKCTMTRVGYTFVGWARTSSAQTARYTDQQSVMNLTDEKGGVVTLYAVWSINSIEIFFNATANGGSVTPLTMSVNYGSSILNLPIATKPYYVFAGWYTAKTGGTKITSSTKFTQPQTLYAQFVIDSSVNIKVNGSWKKGIPYVKVGGIWRKGYAWIKTKSGWKQGLG